MNKYIIAIDLGGTNLKVGLLDLNNKIRRFNVFDTRKYPGKKWLIRVIKSAVEEIIEESHLHKRDILGLGIGVPGPVDSLKGIVHFFPNIPGWKEVKLASILRKELRLPVFLDNDAKMMARAEYALGSGRGYRNVLCITLGTGVGGGIIINGELYRGLDNAAGEFGHLPINEDGPRCNCGGKACLEAYVGNSRIMRMAEKLFKRRISLEELSLRARKNDKLALSIWQDVGKKLGVALTAVVNTLNLDAIVIGGGVAHAGNVLFDPIRETIRQRAMKVQAKRVKVLRAKLVKDAGLIGAALMVKEGLRII
jgi:glucokinase